MTMAPHPLERPKVYVVTWSDPRDGSVRQCRQVPTREIAHETTLMLRGRGYQAGWDEMDPFSGGDDSSGVA